MSTQSIVKKGLVLAVGAGALVVAGASDASALELTNRFESGSSHSSTVTKVSGTRMVKLMAMSNRQTSSLAIKMACISM
ncbi:hypothetical protein HC766_01410 [Candidatus Gracilibacteria bacterium]|nr:hypothetical protein [Candidatus Gracilibacteria bacterium]NJS41032.1 hypothetical protein [Candidatus Gracilibacteria bacterium]